MNSPNSWTEEVDERVSKETLKLASELKMIRRLLIAAPQMLGS